MNVSTREPAGDTDIEVLSGVITRVISSRLIYVLVIICGLILPSAVSFGQESRDFMFLFDIKGYEQDTWFSDPTAVALDASSGLIYVADTKDESVYAFTTQGIPKFTYGSSKGIKTPVGLAVDKEGNLYAVENEGGPIKVISPKGETSDLELPAVEGAEAPKPGRMTFDKDGNLYVVDRANSCVVVLDKEKKLKLRIGKKGDKRGEFRELRDVAVDRGGRIYALDALGTPVQVFDKKGKYIYRFGFRGEGMEDIAIPSAIFVDHNDQVWVVDKGQNCLKVFDRSGTFLRKFGAYGMSEGMLSQPVDAKMDDFGRIFTVETGARRLQVFSLSRPFEPLSPQGL